ncbi:MAG: acyl-CoA synthetase [Ferrovum sp. 37-45-19]|uniref:acyl-CoA synthetase n=1 Tax=Ferrovum sp. JA12 TaxID=1356299 RepID=UPI0007026E16|nr:acyl-CoA synthetase [Ferrovum sp. JA12]KRH78475.1 long-chain-fatty-acid--CoA ligase [Ferrovum sp. JA12]OYV94165.1 MAG: acyl-CoA synthetase [Ferrovum sp. 37-45-19]HQT81434.1 acyl-CoA synthetase [Ferrovaceae bacterium]
MYTHGLEKNQANFVPLSPLSFIERSAEIYPQQEAIVYGEMRRTWRETYQRTRALASALIGYGVQQGDTVAALLPNIPAMVEAHFGVPMAGAVLNTINTRLEPETIAFILQHGQAKLLFLDHEYANTVTEALEIAQQKYGFASEKLIIIDVADNAFTGDKRGLGAVEYEDFLALGDPQFDWQLPGDEWDAICLNYTSGTTGNPKGVVYHHRGAALNAVSNILEWDMPKHPIYLWTLPMFHCNGWCFPWTLAARAGVNVCLRRIEASEILRLMKTEKVTHYCAAPIVHSMLINADSRLKEELPNYIKAMVAGAAPPASMIEGMEAMGIDLTHVYGLTETYGPAAVCVKHQHWQSLPVGERAAKNARQGVRYHLQEAIQVLDPVTLIAVPHDGETMGEIMFRGNITMKGYLKNQQVTQASFAGGWFHTGDLAVVNPDGYVKIKDRSKDIIISGGENISSIEIEDVLYRHPAVLAAAVVAKPDQKWGEVPCAFVEVKAGVGISPEELMHHCRQHLAGFKVPKTIIFDIIPKTSTGKIQKYELRKKIGSQQAIDV